MKKIILLFAMIILQGIPSLTHAQDSDKERAAIVDAISNFAQGADEQNPQKVALSLHPQSLQFLPAPEGVRVFNQEQYLGMLKAKKIGGTPRQMTIESIDITEGYVASANVQLQKEKTVFIHQMSLMKVDNSWQIMNILTLVGTDNE